MESGYPPDANGEPGIGVNAPVWGLMAYPYYAAFTTSNVKKLA
jgi:hypothetical protein